MEYKEYSEKAITVAIYPNKGNNIFYPVLGLIGEMGEVVTELFQETDNSNLKKEIGDVMWYVNAICYELNLSFIDFNFKVEEKSYIQKELFNGIVASSYIAEKTKKLIRDHNSIIDDDYKSIIIEQLQIIITSVCGLSYTLFNENIKGILELNIEKLFSRKKRNVLTGNGNNR
jgi:hypothetical protein